MCRSRQGNIEAVYLDAVFIGHKCADRAYRSGTRTFCDSNQSAIQRLVVQTQVMGLNGHIQVIGAAARHTVPPEYIGASVCIVELGGVVNIVTNVRLPTEAIVDENRLPVFCKHGGVLLVHYRNHVAHFDHVITRLKELVLNKGIGIFDHLHRLQLVGIRVSAVCGCFTLYRIHVINKGLTCLHIQRCGQAGDISTDVFSNGNALEQHQIRRLHLVGCTVGFSPLI